MHHHDDWYGTPRDADVVSDLEEMNVAVDYGVMRFGARAWGVRGHIAYDGDVLAAIFPTEEEAWVALAPLRPLHDPG